jgi:hypothetical protein
MDAEAGPGGAGIGYDFYAGIKLGTAPKRFFLTAADIITGCDLGGMGGAPAGFRACLGPNLAALEITFLARIARQPHTSWRRCRLALTLCCASWFQAG